MALLRWFTTASIASLWILLTICTTIFHAEGIDKNESPKVTTEVILIKVGGSSITLKAKKETLNPSALEWLAETLASSMTTEQEECVMRKKAFVIVHGAGSFGHHTAKEFGLAGQSEPPKSDQHVVNQTRLMEGLAKTRLSVQTLNHHVVSTLIQHGIPAVGISPCFGLPGVQAHGGDELNTLTTIVEDCISAGLVPVIHGDACLYGTGAGILGGDTLMEVLGTSVKRVSRAAFLTDVEGVYTMDPRIDPEAQLIRTIEIDATTKNVLTSLETSGSSHAHDVTGGLEAKLGAAASIAASGTDVFIVKCESKNAEQAIRGEANLESGSLIRIAQN